MIIPIPSATNKWCKNYAACLQKIIPTFYNFSPLLNSVLFLQFYPSRGNFNINHEWTDLNCIDIEFLRRNSRSRLERNCNPNCFPQSSFELYINDIWVLMFEVYNLDSFLNINELFGKFYQTDNDRSDQLDKDPE